MGADEKVEKITMELKSKNVLNKKKYIKIGIKFNLSNKMGSLKHEKIITILNVFGEYNINT